jgi:hypothetical protein
LGPLRDLVSEPRYDPMSKRKLSPDTDPLAWFNALGLHIWRGNDTAALFADPTSMLAWQAASWEMEASTAHDAKTDASIDDVHDGTAGGGALT